MKRFKIAFLGGGFFLVTSLVLIGPSYGLKKIKLHLDWMVGGTHAGFFIAQEKGYYNGADLAVEISRGYGSGDTVKKIAAGMANLGVADFSAVVTGYANEKTPVKAVAVLYEKAALGILYLRESGIRSPNHLEGRTLGRSAAGASTLLFPAFLERNKIERSKIKEVVMDATSLMPALLSGKVDAIIEQTVQKGRIQKAADSSGQKVTVLSMNFADFGLDTYGKVILVRKDLIQSDPELIRSFVHSSLKGFEYAFQNPDESVSLVAKLYPQVTAERAKEELLSLMELTWTDKVRRQGFGWISPEKARNSADVITKAMHLNRIDSIEEIYDGRFVTKK